jgi:hypothetical protein
MLGLLEVTSELCAWMVRPLTPQWHAGERLFKSSRLSPDSRTILVRPCRTASASQ